MTEIVVPKGIHDYSGETLDGIDLIRFSKAPSEAIFAASQFDGVQILDNVTIQGTGGQDTLTVNGSFIDASEWVFVDWGRKNADTVVINGTAERDTLIGSSGRDVISGGDLSDIVTGGDGNDSIDGGAGGDTITGGVGLDVLTGGKGVDTFVYTSVADSLPTDHDNIVDFKHTRDVIDLAAIDAVEGNGDDAFTFIGTAEFSHSAGELRYTIFNGVTFLGGDTNGDGIADFAIELFNRVNFTAGDFVL